MKPIYIIITLLFLGYTIDSNSQTIAEQIIGSWQLDYSTCINMMSSEEKTHYNKMKAIRKVQLENNYKDRLMVFNLDGSFQQHSANGNALTGLWALNNNQTEIEITNLQGKKIQFTIKSINNTSLVLKLAGVLRGRPLMSELYLNKN